MHYTKLFVIFIFSSISLSCANAPSHSTIANDSSTTNTTEELLLGDLKKYKSALLAMKSNQYIKAESLLKEVIQNHPQLAGPHTNLGIIYFMQNDEAKAIVELNKALKLNPKNHYAHNTLALSYRNQGKYTQAEKHFLLAINNNKNYAIAQYNLALLYDIFFHNIEQSINHYKKYLAIIKSQGLSDKKTTNWVEQLINSTNKG